MQDIPEQGWTPVEPFPFAAARKTFIGPTADQGLVSMRYFKRPDQTLVAVAAFGPLSEGAPGQVHGGLILTVLDEALGAAAWVAGHHVMTVRLETDFRATVPVRAELLVETKVTAVRHRMIFVEGRLRGRGGEAYASAQGRFLELGAETHRRIFGRS